MKWTNPLKLLKHKKPDVVFVESPKVEPGVIPVQPRRSVGRIVKTTDKPEYHLPTAHTGGRVVRTIPKTLRKLKEHAEDADL